MQTQYRGASSFNQGAISPANGKFAPVGSEVLHAVDEAALEGVVGGADVCIGIKIGDTICIGISWEV